MNIRELLKKEASQLNLLYVEDEPDTQRKVSQIFQLFFNSVTCAENGENALKLYDAGEYDMVITDLTMPKMDGISFIKALKERMPQQRIIVITAHNNNENLLDTIDLQVDGFLLKPIGVEKLLNLLYKVSHELYLEKHSKHQDTPDDSEGCELSAFKASLFEEEFSIAVLVTIKNMRRLKRTFGLNLIEHLMSESKLYLEEHKPEGSKFHVWSEEFFLFYFQEHDKMVIYEKMKAFVQKYGTNHIEYEQVSFPVIYVSIILSGQGLDLISKMNHIHDAFDQSNKQILSLHDLNDDGEQESALYWVQKTMAALNNDQIIPFYQPIYAFAQEKISAYEILARIEEEGDYLEPRLFIEVSEKAGIVEKVSMKIYEKVFESFPIKEYRMHLNVSEEELHKPFLRDMLRSYIQRNGVAPEQIVLEINYQASYIKEETIKNGLKELKLEGFKILIENFSESQMDMYAFQSLMPDIVKIDQNFLICAFENAHTKKMLEAFICFLKSLSIEVGAVGVETKETWDFVQALGFDFAQGFYLGLPSLKVEK